MTSTVGSVRLEYQNGPSVPVPAPRVSWVTTSDTLAWRQLAAELAWDDGTGTTTHALTGDASSFVAWPFADLAPRQTGVLKVRVQGPDGWSAWSAPQQVVASFLADGEWKASFIGLAEPVGQAQPTLLRTEFDVADGLVRATWYATALGVYSAEVNGTPVDDQILKPGWTPYQYRLVHETTDVTSAIVAGHNAIGVALTGGWYTENFGFQGQAKPFYGTQPAFAGQLLLEYADGSTQWVVTSSEWLASGDGPWVAAGIYAGETYDARRELGGWSSPGFDASA
ncbi:MAG TPA: alpha-L-rhamnosidase N-terminal domain-containing protein, partial [Propionibacteriaceae bacterium]|nr:alpha-L-rhamnosidase N-terminal domain-containing protein [Propionibacteriaceae bacterium]